MSKTICGADCSKCQMKDNCGGCAETNGQPFGGECLLAMCCQRSGYEDCGSCVDLECAMKAHLIREFNALGIDNMPEMTNLYALNGAFVNMEYTLSNGEKVKFLDDKKIYLGNQVEKKGSDRCFGLVADASHLLVCEYGENGADPEIVIYKKRG